MSVSVSIPTTVRIRRGRLIGLVALVAVLAAGVTAIVLTVALDDGGSARSSRPHVAAGTSTPVTHASGSSTGSTADEIMSLTPARLAAGALGSGYALPTKQSGPTVASVLASMSPETRRYTQAVMNLTFAQLAAGAAGQP